VVFKLAAHSKQFPLDPVLSFTPSEEKPGKHWSFGLIHLAPSSPLGLSQTPSNSEEDESILQ
jgi:hypothetical protein